MKYLNIINHSVRIDEDGRYCLNDLHQAAVANGANPRTKEPGKFLSARRTKDLVVLLKKSSTQILGGAPVEPVVTVNGGLNKGTFVVKELVYAYGQFVSAEFDLHIIRTYDKIERDERDRLNGLHFRALRAEMDYQGGLKEAEEHGRGLRKWRDDKKVKLALLEDFRRALQPMLFGG